MPIDLSSINLSLIGWLFIALAVIVLGAAILRFFGHLLHLFLRGCGVLLLVVVVLYVLRLLHVL